jgi:hypothetical protein
VCLEIPESLLNRDLFLRVHFQHGPIETFCKTRLSRPSATRAGRVSTTVAALVRVCSVGLGGVLVL